MTHSYEYPRAALPVDCVVFGMDDEDLNVMLIQRDLPPFEGEWARPGGFVHAEVTIDEAARRAARLYRFDIRKYEQLARNGFHFEI